MKRLLFDTACGCICFWVVIFLLSLVSEDYHNLNAFSVLGLWLLRIGTGPALLMILAIAGGDYLYKKKIDPCGQPDKVLKYVNVFIMMAILFSSFLAVPALAAATDAALGSEHPLYPGTEVDKGVGYFIVIWLAASAFGSAGFLVKCYAIYGFFVLLRFLVHFMEWAAERDRKPPYDGEGIT